MPSIDIPREGPARRLARPGDAGTPPSEFQRRNAGRNPGEATLERRDDREQRRTTFGTPASGEGR